MTELLTLDQIKNWVKVDTTYDDFLLSALGVSCTDYAESYTGLYFIERSVTMSFSGMKTSGWVLFPYIDLMKSLISSIEKIETIIDSTSVTVSQSYYDYKNVNNIGRVVFTTTPSYDANEPYPFKAYFTAGYGSSVDDVPEIVKTAVKTHIAYLYENRGDVQSEGGLSAPLEVHALLNKYRTRYIF